MNETLALAIEGAHPSTEICLEGLQWLHARASFAHILDMGCGNGVLSVVAASLWPARLLAVDISPKALADTAAHVAEHGLEPHIELLRSDGFSEKHIQDCGPYDLIICNLLAQSLAAMAPDIKKNLKSGGYCLFSGILAWMSNEIELAYKGLGFEIVQQITKTPWQGYVMRLKPSTEL